MEAVVPTNLASFVPYLASALLFLLLWEQISYLRKRRHVAGPTLVPPFIGNAVSLVRDPTSFWFRQSALAKGSGLSANYLVGRYILYIRSTDLSLRVFSNVRPDAFLLVGHPFGKKLFGEHNLIYMFGEDHKFLRRQMAPNFSPRALSTYTDLQQVIVLKHLRNWESLGGQFPLRQLVRELNLETSQTVFVGPYLEPEERDQFREDYNLFNVGTMKLPIDLPGFGFRKARDAVSRLVRTLSKCAGKSKARMAAGGEPICLVDFWMQGILRDIAAATEAGGPPPPHSGDNDIGAFLFDFLFAAQDASTSSLLWAVSLLDSHPDILDKVREEVSHIWDSESDGPITADQIAQMKYTRMVAREVVRYRPPATLVPHIAVEDFPLTDSYTIPKGTIVFPSVYDSSFQGFTEPDRFDPERFSEARQEDQTFKRNFLAFGYGPHQCVGQRYALNHLVLFIAMFTTLMDFKRIRSDGCDDIIYCPTISPKDGCTVSLTRRCARYPDLSTK